MTARVRARRACAALVVAACALTAACSDTQPGAAPSPGVSETAPPTPAPPPPAATATLTGTAMPNGPVLAVKVENTDAARPRVGLQQADVVYTEPVEGGLTRLLAVYSTQLPAEVGPIRSARESDVQILGNYGSVAFAFSGASGITRAALRDGSQRDVDEDSSGEGYHRDRGRRAPHNAFGDPATLLARAEGSVPPNDVGFRFGAAPAGGLPTTTVATSWPSSSQSFSWAADQGRWLVSSEGRPDLAPDGSQHGPATVVVQTVRTGVSANRDVNGVRTPTFEMVGTGAAVVLRDGARWDGSWARPDLGSPTTFTTTAGEPMTFAPGQVWVLLVPEGQAVSLS